MFISEVDRCYDALCIIPKFISNISKYNLSSIILICMNYYYLCFKLLLNMAYQVSEIM